jgi:hypothetical protein
VKISVSTPRDQISTLLKPLERSILRVLSDGQKTISQRSCRLRVRRHIVASSHGMPKSVAYVGRFVW